VAQKTRKQWRKPHCVGIRRKGNEENRKQRTEDGGQRSENEKA